MKRLVACLFFMVAWSGCYVSSVTEEEYKDCQSVCFAWQYQAIECGMEELIGCDLDECTEHILANFEPVWCRSVDLYAQTCEGVDYYSATPVFPLQCGR